MGSANLADASRELGVSRRNLGPVWVSAVRTVARLASTLD